MENKVQESTVENIIKNSEVNVETLFRKVTVVTVKLPNGFVLTESSGAVSAANYSKKIGVETCMNRIKDQVWKLEGYKLASELMNHGQDDHK